MSNIQKTLDSLQPYVIGIRYVEGVPVIDTVFKEGWTLPDSDKIKKAKGNDDINYYMIYSELENILVDDLLDYVNLTIKLNIEREKKHELLKVRVNELKEVFKKNTLEKLNRLKFNFGDEELTTITDIDLEEPSPTITKLQNDETMNEEEEKEKLKQLIIPKNTQFLDENKNPIPITDEEREEAAEEARAEAFLKAQKAKKLNGEVKKVSNVELPPKKVEPINNTVSQPSCNCGPDEACSKCIEFKDF